MFDPSAIIVAIASPPGRSVRGIIRASGTGALDVLRHCNAINNHDLMQRGVRFVRLAMDNAELHVPAIALVIPGPHSYTGEDTFELQLPGNPALLDRVMNSLLRCATENNLSARRAEPGEFTARAYFNGKLSLTQAEGVAATIAAQSDAQLRAAHWLSTGSLGNFAHQLADDLANALALVEAGIDFTDQEDVVAIAPHDLHARLLKLNDRIASHLSHAVGIEQLEAIPWVVLVGEPNAGKSALFNALLGHERAVVSPVQGTTRDVLAEPLAIQTDHGPAEVMLVDLAGLDETDGTMNQLMQSAARQAIERAELILRCVPMNRDVESIIETSTRPQTDELLVRTMCDRVTKPVQSEAAARVIEHEVTVSAFTGEGLNDVKSQIAARLAYRAVSLAADAVALRPRHEAALRAALANLNASLELVAPQQSQRHVSDPEFVAASMRAALDDLAALAGDITPDEVLGRVFASFCVGK